MPDIATSARIAGDILRPRNAAITLRLTNGDSVELSSSEPPPSNDRGPTWACKIQGDPDSPDSSSCGAFVAVDEPDANQKQQIRLLIAGAVIALALAVLVESVLKFRWPLEEEAEADE